MNQRQTDLLKSIAHQPRRLHDMTTGVDSISPHCLLTYIEDFVAEGYVSAPEHHRQPYVITDAGLAFLAALPQIAASQVWGPCSTSRDYRSEFRPPARGDGALRAFGLPSRTSFNADLTSSFGCASTRGEA